MNKPHLLCGGGALATDGGEADVVLLDDGRVERVEVHQEDEAVVEPLPRLQHQPARVRRLPPPALAPAAGRLACTALLPLVVLSALRRPLLAVLLVGEDVVPLVEGVQQQELVPLRAAAQQRAREDISSDLLK